MQDLFAGAASSNLTAHTPDVGGAWTEQNTAADGLTQLDGNGGVFALTMSGGGSPEQTINAATPPGADYVITADFRFLSVIGFGCGIRARATAANNYYRLVYNPAGGEWQLRKVVAGTPALVATLADTPSAGNVRSVTWTLAGTSLNAVIAGVGTLVATDASLAAAGKVGLYFESAATLVTGTHIENLTAT